MSYQAINAVLRHSQSKGSARLLLLCIAHHAERDGSGARPAVETLSDEAAIDVRRTKRLLRDLEATGELVTETGGGKTANRYVIALPMSRGSYATAESVSSGSEATAQNASAVAPTPPEQTVVETSVVVSKNKTTLALELESVGDGVAPSVAMELANQFPERIPLQLDCLFDRKPRDAAATIVAAIRGNWGPPAAYKKRKAGERAQEARKEENAREIAAQSAAKATEEAEEARQIEEGARRDAEYSALSDAEKADLETEVDKRMELYAPPLRTEFGRQMMRRELLKGENNG